MARRKVPPDQRQRAAEACNFCRASKKRCSATVPCTQCLRRGIEDSCRFSYRPRGYRNSDVLDRLAGTQGPDAQRPEAPDNADHNRLPFTPLPPGTWDLDRTQDDAGPLLSPSDSCAAPSLQQDKSSTQLDAASADESAAVPEPHPRMLLNSRGERVYIGGAASLSFLQFIRETVAEQIGPSQFTHNEETDRMLETKSLESATATLVPSVVELDPQEKLSYLEIFNAATGGLLDVFASSEVESLLLASQEGTSPAINPCKRATILLIIAIGAQCNGADSSSQVGRPYFRQAQQHALAGMLEDPDVDMVRAFLLMAFYMLGECRRNTAFMYVGIATRAAVALGIHSRHSYTSMNNIRSQLRFKIWISLCILDLLVSTILGRPPATASVRSDLENSVQDLSTAVDNRELHSLIASYGILSITNDAVDRLYENKEISSAVVEQLLARIDDWSRSMPESLRNSPVVTTTTSSSGAEAPDRKAVTAKLHISCIYYFTVTLVTRPILISTLTASPGISTPTHLQLASACSDAATFLVQTCVDARGASLLLANMCIVKALVFAAGLILGFNMFAGGGDDPERYLEAEATFRGAREILRFLAAQSPQAAHYHEILSCLAKAIARKREKTAQRGRSKYVGKLFSFSSEAPDEQEQRQQQQVHAETALSPGSSSAAQAAALGSAGEASMAFGRELNWLNTLMRPGQENAMALEGEGELFLGLDSLELSQWDNFPFLTRTSPDTG
ncbi:hypothetical protein F5Y15DRAFT_395765 [Xylariaceae sp. FL0016]|nr:hypothetical protein F5Y15DRAFT_395765 [Xylariaceae sp. FL0016]